MSRPLAEKIPRSFEFTRGHLLSRWNIPSPPAIQFSPKIPLLFLLSLSSRIFPRKIIIAITVIIIIIWRNIASIDRINCSFALEGESLNEFDKKMEERVNEVSAGAGEEE